MRFLGEVEGWVGEMEARRVAVAEKLERARIVRDLDGKGRVEEGEEGAKTAERPQICVKTVGDEVKVRARR